MSRKFGNALELALGFGCLLSARHAIMVPGPAIAEARGKAGGMIFSRNRGGQYFRSFAAPINPQTTLQQSNRVIFGQLVGEWNNTLTAAQRTGWNDFGEANPVPNALGQDILLSGQNWFIKANHDRVLAGVASEPNAPATTAAPVQDPLIGFDNVVSGAQTADVDFDATHPWADLDDAALLIFIGKPQGSGVSRFGGPWRFASATSGNSVTPPTSPINAIPMPWNVVTGQQVWGKAVIVQPGLLASTAFNFGPIVVTAA